MPIKVLDASGEGPYADVIDGILYAADHGARVLNLSLGGYTDSQLLADAVGYAHAAGAILVAAGGNEATSDPLYPAAFPNVIGVSATDVLDHIWTASNPGSYIKLSAPGVGVLSAGLTDGYSVTTGTSLAAAHISGVAALVFSKNPDRSNTQTEQILYQTADDLGEPGKDQIYGYGRVNAAKALRMTSIEVHDVAVIGIRVQPQTFRVGEATQIIVTIQNQGTFVEENIGIRVFVNGALQDSFKRTDSIIEGRVSQTNFRWTPSWSEYTPITIRAEAEAVKGETDLNDNVLTASYHYEMNEDDRVGLLFEVKPPVHQWISCQAVLKLPNGPLKSEISRYVGTPNCTDPVLTRDWIPPSTWTSNDNWYGPESTALLEGTWEEDHPFWRVRHHFWDPTGGYDDGLFESDSALEAAADRFERAVTAYVSNTSTAKAEAYWWLGRTAHLLEDMASPSHVHKNQHATDIENDHWYTAYESRSKGPIYKLITASSPGTEIPSPGDLPSYPVSESLGYDENLVRLFAALATYTKRFDSDDKGGTEDQGRYNSFDAKVSLAWTPDRIVSIKWYKQTTNGDLSTGTATIVNEGEYATNRAGYEYDIGNIGSFQRGITKPSVYLYPNISDPFDEPFLFESEYDVLEIKYYDEDNILRTQLFSKIKDFVGTYHLTVRPFLRRFGKNGQKLRIHL